MENKVKRQYEALPYPFRPERTAQPALRIGTPSAFHEIDYFVFGGGWDLSRPLKVLVAGGGTGDAVIQIAFETELIGCGAEITYLDLSTASRAIAEQRVAAYGYSDRVQFLTGRIEDLTDIGPFDYIDCCGVLHHLPDPDAGLCQLNELLAPHGGMGLMVYAPYGRTGIYPMQQMMRQLEQTEAQDPTVAEQIDLAKRVLAKMPNTHPLQQNHRMRHPSNDAEFYDRFLHAQDRSYTVTQLDNWVRRCGLRRTDFAAPLYYQPELYFEPASGEAPLALPPLSRDQRQALAELAAGWMSTHSFYCVKEDNPIVPPRPTDPTLIPTFRSGTDISQIFPSRLYSFEIHRTYKKAFPLNDFTINVLKVIDGKRNLGQIHHLLCPDLDWENFVGQLTPLHQLFVGSARLMYRQPAPTLPS